MQLAGPVHDILYTSILEKIQAFLEGFQETPVFPWKPSFSSPKKKKKGTDRKGHPGVFLRQK